MQKSRPRRTAKQTAPTGEAEQTPTVGRGRPTHVRNRLIVAVAVVAAAIAGAGTPSVLAASGELKDSQDLVTLAEQTRDALALAHSLADERDDVTSYIAAGRPKAKAPSEEHSARVDRQVEELRADTGTSDVLRDDLDAIAAVRRAALTGKSSALEAHQAYSAAITQLHRLAEQLAQQTPPRAGSGAYALAELDSAVQQAAAARGLLLAALNVPSATQTVIDPITGLPSTSAVSSDADTERRDALTAAALQARLRSDAALADFRDTAPKAARASYDATVTGPEVNSADKYLARLTDEPTLSDDELGTDTKKLRAALTARVEMMRGAESALFDQRVKDLAQLRDDDVTALEIRVAVLGALMLLAIGITTGLARSLTRPLSVLRRGSARLAGAEDPGAEEPITFTGRNDEFAQVVRSVNALHAHAVGLAGRIATLEADRKHLVGQRQKMADAREELRAELDGAAAQLERLRTGIGGTFVNLALRTLGLVERQLGVIESLEEREDDPDRLATLFKLDHFATVMRRHSENLLVLAGTEHVQHTAGPVPLVDVVRAAVSEIERYERVRIAALPPHAHIAGFAADDLSHLLAELMENATSFSPPDLPVEASGWLLENGEVMLSVQDEGIGMTEERLERLNSRLSEFDPEAGYDQEVEDGLGLGLYVVARLAHRHGVRVRLRKQKQGGIAAVVVLPKSLLASAEPSAVPTSGPVPGGTHAVSLPGADAEANSNVLHGRRESDDPLVALAEKAVRHQESTRADASRADSSTDSSGSSTETGAEPEGGDAADTEDTAGDRARGHDANPAADRDGEPAEDPAAEPAADADAEGARMPSQRLAETTMELLIPSPSAAADDATAPPAMPGAAPSEGAGDTGTAPDEVGHTAVTEPSAAGAGDDRGTEAGAAPGAGARPSGEHTAADATDDARTASDVPATAGTPRQSGLPTRPVTPDRPAPAAPSASDSARDAGDAGDEHARVPDGPVEDDPVTAKGLPKRTPKITTPAQAPRPRTGSVDAEALRRRLGGFRRGAEAGRRDVAVEIAEQTGPHDAPSAATATTEEATGGTVEEASS
ncbi:sensor histidine kinase [Streptomyces viridosporus]|uniref:histidine kinase n=1 Tax=Streptomyces viridosporus T7A TaxID=665577 RepID=A0ABX6AIN4_STRVD|nr:nitrate- and nitrite sensing domain-containing protein [Streptomyces viridosporus]QEU87715.1 HAMP domain-containing protein [Streptomyces viridosporus T7A]